MLWVFTGEQPKAQKNQNETKYTQKTKKKNNGYTNIKEDIPSSPEQ
jgi:hypothetical protein